VLRPWSALKKENTLDICEWSKDDSNIWIRRASCVTFITLVKLKDEKNFEGFIDLMFETCQTNITYQERFNQLATGWLLRELSKVDKKQFMDFFFENFKHFSREGLRYAVEKLPEREKNKLLNYRPQEEAEEKNYKRKK
jgi:3-methyladenine DNA glycosylase AlkD